MNIFKYFTTLIVCYFLFSCAYLNRYDWKLLPDSEELYSHWSMASDQDGNLWFVPRFGKLGGLYRVAASGHQTVIIPSLENDAPKYVCAGNGNKINFLSFEGRVARISLHQNQDVVPEVLKIGSKYQGAGCLVLGNENILVWRDNWIENISSDGISKIAILNTDVGIINITLDPQKRPIALTRNGQIYLFIDNTWLLNKELKINQDPEEIFYRVYWIDNSLWIATNKRLVKWDERDQSYEVILTDLDHSGEFESYVYEVFEDIQGKTWVISSYAILQFDINDNRIDIDFPRGVITDAVYISSLDRIYIANNGDSSTSGILYLDLSK